MKFNFIISIICTVSSTVSAIASALAASKSYKMQKAIKKKQEKLDQEKRKEFEYNVFKLYCYTNHLLENLKTYDESTTSLTVNEMIENAKNKLDPTSQIREYYNCVIKSIKILSLGSTHSAASFKEADLIFEIQEEMPELTYQSYSSDFVVENINIEDLNSWCMDTINKIKNNFDFIKQQHLK